MTTMDGRAAVTTALVVLLLLPLLLLLPGGFPASSACAVESRRMHKASFNVAPMLLRSAYMCVAGYIRTSQ
jgi:hypothetical protein